MIDRAETDARSDLAAVLFPVEWARVSTADGDAASKRRQELRKAARLEMETLTPLRARGASCDNCGACVPTGRPIPCAHLNKYHGLVRACMGRLCPHWAPNGATETRHV